jgi:putative oxidoreductase
LNTPFARLLGRYALAATNLLDLLSSLFQLALRLFVANVFFNSGLTKIRDFSSTVALFENEYMVPLLSPLHAAMLGTAAELVLPVLLVLGLASRPTAIAMFVFNLIALISYPDISAAGMKDHVLWGMMLLVTVFYGPGRVSLDHFLRKRFVHGN